MIKKTIKSDYCKFPFQLRDERGHKKTNDKDKKKKKQQHSSGISWP